MADELNPQSITTAEALGGFYKALIAEGVPEDTASRILIEAASTIVHNEGLAVKASA